MVEGGDIGKAVEEGPWVCCEETAFIVSDVVLILTNVVTGKMASSPSTGSRDYKRLYGVFGTLLCRLRWLCSLGSCIHMESAHT